MGWAIALAVILAIFLLLCCSAAVRLEYFGDIRVKISYLCFTVLKYPAEKKKNRRRDKKSSKAVKAADKAAREPAEDGTEPAGSAESGGETASEKAEKSASEKREKKSGERRASLGDYFELAKLIADSLGKPLKKLLKRTRIYRLRINVVCGGEDAAKAALNFGKTNVAIGNALGWADSFFKLMPAEEIRIDADFQSEETTAEASCVIKASLLTLIAFLVTLLFRAVRYYRAHPEAKRAVGVLKEK